MKYQNNVDEKAASIKQRILELSVILGITRNDLIDKLDGSNSNFSGKSKYAWPSTKTCVRIAENFPQISLDWLIMGWGSPMRDTPPDTSIHQVAKNRPKKSPEHDVYGFDKLLARIEEQAKQIALLEYQLDYFKSQKGGDPIADTQPGKKMPAASPRV